MVSRLARSFALDLASCEVRRHGHRVRLQRQPMDLLILLVERRGQLVQQCEIVQALWAKQGCSELPGLCQRVDVAEWGSPARARRRGSERVVFAQLGAQVDAQMIAGASVDSSDHVVTGPRSTSVLGLPAERFIAGLPHV